MPPGTTPSATLEEEALPSQAQTRWRQGLAEMGVQDWFVLAYHALLVLAVSGAAPHPDKARAFADVFALLLVFVATLVLVRGRFLGAKAEGLLYRFTLIGTVEMSYFMFRRVLPVVNPRALDLDLYHLDLQLFGLEPALAAQRFVTPALTEWFSFFYFGYFFLLSAHVLPIVFSSREKASQHEFTFGVLLTFCVGHLTYMLVPGFGPGVAMPEAFTVALPSGPWFDTMLRTVETGGAQKDIFPSIHTAVPTYLTLWSYRHKQRLPYRHTWPLVAFFSFNIILATMYLRWHYLIDVVAGFCLGSFALAVSVLVTRRETIRRAEGKLRPVWPDYPLF